MKNKNIYLKLKKVKNKLISKILIKKWIYFKNKDFNLIKLIIDIYQLLKFVIIIINLMNNNYKKFNQKMINYKIDIIN